MGKFNDEAYAHCAYCGNPGIEGKRCKGCGATINKTIPMVKLKLRNWEEAIHLLKQVEAGQRVSSVMLRRVLRDAKVLCVLPRRR